MIDVASTAFMMVSLIALAILLLVWRWQRSAQHDGLKEQKVDRNEENILAYKFQSSELSRELELGNIDEAGYDKLLAEMQEQLLESVESEEQRIAGETRSGSSLLVFNVSLAMVLLATLAIYLPQGLSLGAMEEAPIADQVEALGTAGSREEWTSQALELDRALRLAISPDAADDRTFRMLSLHAQLLKGLTRYDEAAAHYRRLASNFPEEAFYASSAVEASYFARSFKQQRPLFTAEMDAEMDQLLADFPEEPMLLSLSGTSAFEKADYQLAATRWQAALDLLPAGSPQRAELEQGLQLVRARLASAETGLSDPVEQEDPVPDVAYVRVRIDIDRTLIDGDAATTPVFVFARASGGGPLPLAAKRLQLRHLPAELYLTANDAMAGASIADVDRVVVAARLSRGGDPRPQSGDLESASIELQVQRGGEPPREPPEMDENQPPKDTLIINQLVP